MRTPLALAIVGMLAVASAGSAEAHKTTYSADGKIKIVWGFLDEPAVTMTKTGLDLILTDNATGAPIDGVTSSSLTVEMHKGDAEWQFKDFGAQYGQHGRYTGVITLTEPGLYVLHLTGTINGTDLGPDGIEIPGAHPVEDINDTYFPPRNSTDTSATIAKLQSDVKALQDAVAALNAKAETRSTTPATVSPAPTKRAPGPEAGVGSLAVGAAALAISGRRRA